MAMMETPKPWMQRFERNGTYKVYALESDGEEFGVAVVWSLEDAVGIVRRRNQSQRKSEAIRHSFKKRLVELFHSKELIELHKIVNLLDEVLEDNIDRRIAKKRLKEIKKNPKSIIRGKALEKRLRKYERIHAPGENCGKDKK